RLGSGERSGHDISLTVEIDAGVPIRDLRSPSHQIEVERDGERRAQVRLDENDAIPNKDFILRYDVAGELPEIGVLTHRDQGDGFFSLVLQPKAEVSEAEAAPKEIIFVLDTS